MPSDSRVSVAIVGCGYWGPNLIRNFASLREFKVAGIADSNPQRLAQVAREQRIDRAVGDADELFEDPDVEAVAIATPVSTHTDLARRALLAGKHVLLTKPMADSTASCDELLALAEERNLLVAVDHTFLFTSAVECIKDMLERQALGDIYYVDSTRVNLGLFQHDTNVLWDLAPHDLSIILHWIDEEPTEVHAVGAAPVSLSDGREESIAYITLRFPSGIIGHVNVNWLAPAKVRHTMIGGSRRMVVWDDTEPDTKVKVYDRGVDAFPDAESVYRTLITYRTGDMRAPRLDRTEALRTECLHFFRCIRHGEEPRSDGYFGRKVVRLLEHAQRSLELGGERVKL